MVTKITPARKKFVFVSENQSDKFLIVSTGACELSSVTITAGGSAATFRLVDANNFVPGQPTPSYSYNSGPAYAVESSNSFSPHLAQPLPFTKGLVIVCEQGEGSNAECSVGVN